ncbi:hypothetical protein [Microbispora sp. CSR-4]|uniref:hypothetical protein n=1 Tax=Microbispora sp. CSR-4 TaxID=2592813 RepID=UPI0011C73DE5|nr:hypothetical protein [Microbispora sp. CSR-4]
MTARQGAPAERQGSPAGGRAAPAARWRALTARQRALVVWAALVVGAFAVGGLLHARGVLRIDHLPPLHALARLPTPALLPAVVFAAVAVPVLPRLTANPPMRAAPAAAFAASLAWTVLLAVSGDGLAWPFTHPQEYLAGLGAVGDDPLGWLAGFTRDLSAYPTHVRGHPPLPVLVLWALAAIGLPGPFWAALLVVVTGCSATVAIGLTVWRVAGEDAARRVLPHLALCPAAVWIATTMDAFFAGVGAWGTALLVLGARSRAGRVVLGLGAGLALGALPYLSYGMVPFLLVPLVAALVVGVPRSTVAACLAGMAAVSALFAAGGFWWPAGVLATHAEWAADPGAERPYLYFLVANLAVLALVTGPATAAGLVAQGRARDRILPMAALVAVLALDVSGVTRGEVERIWLPYALWVAAAAGRTGTGREGDRRLLVVQAVVGLLLQGFVKSPW